MSNSRVRRDWIVGHVRDHKRIALAEVRRATVARWKCSESTFYEDIAWLAVFNRLQRIPTGHGDDLAAWGTLQGVADPAFVRERARGVLNGRLTKELRTQYAADLQRVGEGAYILPDESLLKVCRVAILRRALPGSASVIDL